MTASLISPAPRPGAAPPGDYQFPRFERRCLENGLEVVVAPVTKLPVLTVAAIVDAGSVCDPRGEAGVARLTAKLLLEGTAESDGGELTERFERLGATVEAQADWDAAAVSVTALSDNAGPTFALLGEVLRSPAFRDREVERLKAERHAELLQLRAEPRGLADEFFSRTLYEAGSRYALPDGGDETSVAALSRASVGAFYASRYAPAATTIVVVGDVTADAAERLARATLGDWKGTTPARLSTSDRPARLARAAHLVAKADAPQSELRIGHVGLPRKHPDYFPAVVMNAVLGGLFNSRINLNLREAHGYTYGAFSAFEWRRQSGPFAVSTAVKSDVTDAAAREVLLEIDRIRAEPIGDDELSLATSYLDGVFPIRYETTAAIAAALGMLVVHGLSGDYFDRYRARVRGVTKEHVLEAARKYLRPEELQMVVVGDPATVRGPLEALRFGPLYVLDTQGRVVDA
jgi:zinc protease